MARRINPAVRERTATPRRLAILLVVVLATMLGGTIATAGAVGDCTPSAGWGTLQPSLESQVVQLVNDHRAAMGLGALSVASSLSSSAEWKSLHMAAYNYLAHDDPGPPVSRTVSDRFAACGYPANAAGWGENIAEGYPDASSVMAGWLGDAPHKANIENPAWTTIGVGVARSASGTLYWTQDFGTTGASSPPPGGPAPSVSDTQPPSVPSGLAAGAASGTTVNFSWQPSTDDTGVAGYDVIVNGAVLGTTTSTAGTVGGLSCGTGYTLGVDAFDAVGNHSAAATIGASTPACSGSPVAPLTSQQLTPQQLNSAPPAASASGGAPSPVASGPAVPPPSSAAAQPPVAAGPGSKADRSSEAGSHATAVAFRVLARTRTSIQLRWPEATSTIGSRYRVLVDGVSRTTVGQAGVMLRRLACGRPHRVVVVALGPGGAGSKLALRVAAKACGKSG